MFSRSYVGVVGGLLSVVLIYYFYTTYKSKIGSFYTEYQKFKEMKFVLNNLSKKSISNDESSINNFFISNGFHVESVQQIDGSYKVVLNSVSPDRIPFVVYNLEANGFNIKSFKYTDNTGTGNGKLYLTF